MTLTDVPGITVGHATDEKNRTGCTAVMCPEGAVAGVDVRGHAPGTRETDLLHPTARVERVQAVLVTGGSAFGLAAATGVVRWLAERGYGHETLHAKVPLVPGAVIYDLFFNKTLSKPDEAMGCQAAEAASGQPVAMGCVGAGTGATAGKLAGFHRAMKSGLGSAGTKSGDLIVAALAVANPVGNVIDPESGAVLAGVRTPDGSAIDNPDAALLAIQDLLSASAATNTVLGVIATNAVLTKVQATRVARMASAGIARAISPAFTLYDGDVIFVLATGRGPAADENIIGALGAQVLARAIAAGAKAAVSLPEVPAYRDMPKT